jgi:ATP-dependent Lhr-like helicase
MNSYSRLAPFLREYIYGEKWKAVRAIQEETIREVFDGKGHILIASGTASGKTEAAFLPLISLLAEARDIIPKPLVLYISPLKALINDQYERLGKIININDTIDTNDTNNQNNQDSPVRLWRWHGDVAENHKKQFLSDPRGILQITPESLEALLLRRARDIKRVFAGLVFVVIDEVHVFMGSERGSQLICQLARIEQECASGGRAGLVRRIGLSATLWDYEGGKAWLSRGTGIPAVLVNEKSGKRILSLAVDYFRVTDVPENSRAAFYRALYGQCRNKRAIIFTNSRLEAEHSVAALRRIAFAAGEADIFHIHHGSVAAPLRGEAEKKLKNSEGPSVTTATATLELGIDIGDLDRIIQIGPPWSVSAFVQRLGRSGRRSGKPEMYFTIMDSDVSIPWDLLRTIAVIELYLNEQWIEPPEEKKLPYSLFVHEILSLLGSLGEHSIEALKKRLFAMPPFAFSSISEDDFTLILDHLRKCRYVEKIEDGGLLLAPDGERIVNRHSFYSVFPGEETYRVILEGHEMGTEHL